MSVTSQLYGKSLEELATELTPLDMSQAEASGFDGFGTAVGSGVMKGGVRTAQFAGLALATAPMAIDAITDDEYSLTDQYFKGMDESINNAADYWTPSAIEVGSAGRIMGGLAEMALPMMISGGNPLATGVVVSGAQTAGTGIDLVNQGVDGRTAGAVAAIQGLSTYAGFKIPFLGKTLTQRLGFGVGSNLSINTATEGAQYGTLKAGDYDKQADMYNPMNIEARAVDVLTGLVFGGFAHVTSPKTAQQPSLKPSEVDAVLTARNAKNFQHDSAPGRLDTIDDSINHQLNMEQALEQIIRGEPVNVTHDVPMDTPPQALDFGARSIDELEAEYAALPQSEGGKVFDTDIIRELSSDYRKDRTLSGKLHKAASDLNGQLFTRALAKPVEEGKAPVVLFTAGGGGSGKSSATEKIRSALSADITLDGTLSKLDKAKSNIEATLASGRDVEIVYVYRSPEKSVAGAITRAIETRRPVSVTALADAHANSPEVVKELAKIYTDNERVHITAIWNDGELGTSKPISLEDIPHVNKQQAEETFRNTLDSTYQNGELDDQLYKAFGGSLSARPELRTKSGRPSEPQLAGRREDPVNSETLESPLKSSDNSPILETPVSAALKMADESPDTQIMSGYDADGEPQYRPISDILADIETERLRAEQEATGYTAAINCFLRRGE